VAGTVLSLRPPGTPRDIPRWYLASFAGTCACILLYTGFGLFFVRLHARMIADESVIIGAYGMTRLIAPDDGHLWLMVHQLSSALFFGLTLGVLAGLVCMTVTLPAWISGRLIRIDPVALLGAGFASIFLSYSRELPLVSVVAGILCPVCFVLPWAVILRAGKGARIRWGRWALFGVILVSPLTLALVPGSTFLNMRNAMVTLPVVSGLSDFYYEHTLLPADVIKPFPARSQNVIALSRTIEKIGPIPHGTLWVRTKDPCGVRGARVVLGRGELPCTSVILPDDRPANDKNRVFNELAERFDPNRFMRRGLGIFFYSGPMLIMTALLLSWFALGLERAYARSRAAAVVVVLAYLSFFVPAFHGAYLLYMLERDPQRIAAYALSHVEKERYLAVSTYPGALTTEALAAMLKDSSARVRINALIEAGERRDRSLFPLIDTCADDPQLNVRTKACQALGALGSVRSLEVLERVVRDDPAWYVRDYAYAAIGRIRPEAKVVLEE